MDRAKLVILEVGETEIEKTIHKRKIKYSCEGVVKENYYYGCDETIDNIKVGDVIEF